MANKLLGLGTVLVVNAQTVTLAIDATPPPRKRVLIDGSTLSDTLATNEAGMEDISDYEFNQFWEPGDSMHETLDTLFGSKASVTVTIQYTDTGTTTDSFSACVAALEPATIQKDNLYMRKVTLHRLGSITRS